MSILITGGDGYIGSRLAKQLLNQNKNDILLWCRADSDEEKASKTASISEFLSDIDTNCQYDLYWGNLTEDDAFSEIPKEQVNQIVHTAAVTRFNVEPDLADQINRDGARRLFTFAQDCPHLKHLCFVSTVYTCGMSEGDIAAQQHSDNFSYANHYERSKAAAENILINEFSSLPYSIARVATVIADNEQGVVSQFNVFHNTARLLYHGLLSLLPGVADAPIYLVTGQQVVDSLLCIIEKTGRSDIFHLCHAADKNPTVEQLIDSIFRGFANDEAFQQKRIMKPLLAEKAAFDRLAAMFEKGLGGDMMQQSLSSIRPFAHQLYSKKNFLECNQLDDWQWQGCVDGVVEYLVNTKWGRHPYTAD